ncbi:MAG: YpdA family putative bacillithiol disulfide reductase [Cyclobacteriaceae bacterium]|nr:YpdA family putative bacillithiol disulfide reductase [Cyclobacteriaceae bacterium]
MELYDVIIIGAGPCGLACAIEAQHKKLKYLIVDKGSITESIRRYPVNMLFFSTSENIEIGKVPFVSMGTRPTRTEALKYYRKVVNHFDLHIKLFTRGNDVKQVAGVFELTTNNESLRAKKIIVATGYYDVPRYLEVRGETMPHVSHYYDEAFRYSKMKAVVVGGANSAVETALDLFRNDVEVTLVHLFDNIDPRAKYWIVPDLENRIKKDEIKAYFRHRVTEIYEKSLIIENLDNGKKKRIDADFVFLMTGYRPDAHFLEKVGIRLEGENLIPTTHPETYESNIEGIYLAGSIIGGEETAKIFIENGRMHGKPIIEDILKKL